MVQTLFCLCLQYVGLLVHEVCFDNDGKPDSNSFSSLNGYKSATHYQQLFLEIKVYLARDIEGIVLLCGIASPEIISFSKLSNHQNDHYRLIHQADLIYFQVCNM